MTQTIQVTNLPVLHFAKWFGVGGAVLGFFAGLFVLLMTVTYGPDDLSPAAVRILFGYAAPLTYGIGWGLFGFVGGAFQAATYNHLAQWFGGLHFECELSETTSFEA